MRTIYYSLLEKLIHVKSCSTTTKPRRVSFNAWKQTQGSKLSPRGGFYLLGRKGKNADEWRVLGAAGFNSNSLSKNQRATALHSASWIHFLNTSMGKRPSVGNFKDCTGEIMRWLLELSKWENSISSAEPLRWSGIKVSWTMIMHTA